MKRKFIALALTFFLTACGTVSESPRVPANSDTSASDTTNRRPADRGSGAHRDRDRGPCD